MPVAGRPARRAARWRRTRPTRLAWRTAMLSLGVASAAINTGNTLLYLLLSLTLATIPVSWIAARLTLRRLSADLAPPAAPTARAPYLLELVLRHTGGAPAARAVRVLLGGDRDAPAETTVERVDPGDKLRLSLPRRAPKPGLYRIPSVRLRTSFPLGMLLVERELPLDTRVLVLPPAVESRSPEGEAGHDDGGRRTDDPGGTEFDGLRPGGAHDDPRRIDWKATARRGSTVLRDAAGQRRPRLTLRVSTRRDGGERRDAFERELIDAGSRGRAMLAREGEVRLVIDDAAPAAYVGRADVSALLARLAALTPRRADGRAAATIAPLPPVRSVPGAARPSPEPERSLRRSARVALGIGTLGLTAFGGIGPIAGLILLGALVATHVKPGLVASPNGPVGRLWRVAGVAALVFFVVDLVALRHNPLVSSIDLVLFISVFAVFSARRPRDDGQILLISFLHVILAAALTTEIAFAAMLTAWLLVTTHGAIAASVLGRTRDSPGAIRLAPRRRLGPRYWRAATATALATIVLAAPLYLAVPHLGTGAFRGGGLAPRRASGFGGETRLGDIGRIKLDDSRVMEVALRGQVPPGELRWRGLVHDRFDGRGWTNTESAARTYVARDGAIRLTSPRGDSGGPVIQQIRLEPGRSTALFAVPGVSGVRSGDIRFIRRNPSGTLELPAPPTRRLRYEVESHPALRDPGRLRGGDGADPDDTHRWLQLPQLDPRVAELAARLTAGAATRYDRAVAIERWLSRSIDYSLDVDDAGRADPLAAFLFDGMAGHCEYFATSMVVLAREAGIPARFAAGYLRGSENRLIDGFVVRQSDAHAWAELYFPGTGWVAFDATPAEGRPTWAESGLTALASSVRSTLTRWWDDLVVGLDLDDQLRVWLSIFETVRRSGRPIAALLLFAVIWFVAAAIVGRRRDRSPAATGARRAARRAVRRMPRWYRALLRRLARHGLTLAPSETAAELADRARATLPVNAAATVGELTRLYETQRFGGGRDAAARAKPLLGRLRGELGGAVRRRSA